MLYIFDEIESMDDDAVNSMISLLSDQRITKVQKLQFGPGKKASVLAYLLLRIALLEQYGIDEAVEFDFAENGKPMLPDFPQIHFNLSHSKGVVACAVSDVEVGVDVQHITPISDKVAKRVLTETEYALFIQSFEPNDFFCEIWTVKESYLKKTGQGITVELRDITADAIKDKKVFCGKDYFCCVCGPEMQIKHVRRNDFEQLCK